MLDPESYFKGQAVALSTALWSVAMLNVCGKQIDDKSFEVLKKEFLKLAREVDQLASSILNDNVGAVHKMEDAIEEVKQCH